MHDGSRFSAAADAPAHTTELLALAENPKSSDRRQTFVPITSGAAPSWISVSWAMCAKPFQRCLPFCSARTTVPIFAVDTGMCNGKPSSTTQRLLRSCLVFPDQRGRTATDGGLGLVRRSSGMKIITRNTHGLLDYPVGLILAVSPWLFGFADDGPATVIPVVLGAGAVIYSLLTNYELGVARVIPFRVHLVIDFVSGLFLAVSPWLFNFSHHVYWPHLIFGLLEMGVVLLTRAEPVPVVRQAVRQ